MPALVDLQEAIIDVLAGEKSYNLPAICVLLGLEDGTEAEAFDSKRRYVRKRLAGQPKEALIEIANKCVEQYNSERLTNLVNSFGTDRGVVGPVKNLIFAANGPKPEIILADAVGNTIEIVRNAEYCLVYALPISQKGLRWNDLVTWWTQQNNVDFIGNELEDSLYQRLNESLASEPEKLLFHTYYQIFKDRLGEHLPALIPQVYLHYDPKTVRELFGNARLPRQRMDFLILFSNQDRVVIEVDGKQHYAIRDTASPQKYAEMVAADRQLRLSGYEIYRFGGYELQENRGEVLVEDFFSKLFAQRGIR